MSCWYTSNHILFLWIIWFMQIMHVMVLRIVAWVEKIVPVAQYRLLDWWCRKYHHWATRSSCALDKNLHNTKAEDFKRSIDVVLAKYPPTVKLEKSLVHNSRVPEPGWIIRTFVCEGIGAFYNSKGLTSLPWCRFLYLIRILMSVFFEILSL